MTDLNNTPEEDVEQSIQPLPLLQGLGDSTTPLLLQKPIKPEPIVETTRPLLFVDGKYFPLDEGIIITNSEGTIITNNSEATINERWAIDATEDDYGEWSDGWSNKNGPIGDNLIKEPEDDGCLCSQCTSIDPKEDSIEDSIELADKLRDSVELAAKLYKEISPEISQPERQAVDNAFNIFLDIMDGLMESYLDESDLDLDRK